MPVLNQITVNHTLMGKIRAIRSSNLVFKESIVNVASTANECSKMGFNEWKYYISKEAEKATSTFSVENIFLPQINITTLF